MLTPAQQQAALERVIGRPLTADELTALGPDVALRKDVQIAATLTSWQEKIHRSITVEDMYDVLYFSGDYLVLKTAQLAGTPLAVMVFSILADAKQLGPGTVNLAASQTQGLFSQLQAANLLSQAGIDALNARALVDPPPIHYNTVSDALNEADNLSALEN